MRLPTLALLAALSFCLLATGCATHSGTRALAGSILGTVPARSSGTKPATPEQARPSAQAWASSPAELSAREWIKSSNATKPALLLLTRHPHSRR